MRSSPRSVTDDMEARLTVFSPQAWPSPQCFAQLVLSNQCSIFLVLKLPDFSQDNSPQVKLPVEFCLIHYFLPYACVSGQLDTGGAKQIKIFTAL